ncbi:MAG: TetM/TetW/TetO/TetS family tetracycline resistance ribosomal protection protein [Clostridia bacterium]|nr:TetM/TetW/TetO/TetS family tetracycline resistance ribosomal protection protein [Clostridia bacterium]
MTKPRLICALTAHVDAGKTTLSEAMLFLSGRLRQAGRVDRGSAFLDTEKLEKERGITIFSKQAELEWKKRPITLVDTPGHADFSGETERALEIADCAVMVISGTEGPQSHTLALWRVLEKLNCPVFFFINKCDRPETDAGEALRRIREELTPNAVDMTADDAMEQAAMCDEVALDCFLREGTIQPYRLNGMIRDRRLFPVYSGSALAMTGVDALMDALEAYEAPVPDTGAAFGARVYKIARDPSGGRLTFLKVTGGTLRVRDQITDGDFSEKAAELRFYSGARFRTAESCPAGEICAVLGLSRTGIGMGLGREAGRTREAGLLEPVYTCRLIPSPGQDMNRVLICLKILEEEEPLLKADYRERDRQIHIRSMGDVQLQVLQSLMRDRFGIPVTFGESGILYRETVAETVEGVGHWEPLRHYAEVHILLQPLPRDSGLQFATAVPLDDLALNWQRLILTHMKEKVHLGVLTGAPITDIRMTLVAGRAHLKHTEGGDFRQATYRAIRQGLMKAKSVLLEPWVDALLTLPRDCLGRAMTDLEAMGGTFETSDDGGEKVRIHASAPAAGMREYPKAVRIYTHGDGNCVLTPAGYRPCADADRVIAEKGYDPERDIDNSPDSVFCSHGAGVTVKWNETEKHMHLPMREEPSRPDSAVPAVPVRRERTPYRGTEEEDRELKAIFERTYGPSRSRELFRPAAPPSQPAEAPVSVPDKEYLLVDGYNIIFAWDELKEKASDSVDAARQELLDILCNYRGVMNCEVIVVFDAYRVKGNPGSVEKYNNIYVVYTREAETADSYIERTTFLTKGAIRIRVATSDGPEQTIILGNRALRISAREFHREVDGVTGSIREFLRKNNITPRSGAMEKAIKEAWLKKKTGN